MKASLITLLPLACSVLAAPAVSKAVAERQLLGDLLGSLDILPLAPLGNATALPELNSLATVVTDVVTIVQSIDSLLTGATDVSTIVPSLTSQLDSLQSKISSVQSAVSDVSGSDGLSLLQAAGVSGLLNRVYNAVATLLDGVTTVTSDTSLGSTLDPVTTLVNQIVTSLGPILNLNLIQGTSL